jgi:hypothetical protein
MQSARHSRCRGGDEEPITARTNLYTCLCTQEYDTSHPPDRVQDQVARLATLSQGARQITGPLTEGLGSTSRPGSLPAPRVDRCFHTDHQGVLWFNNRIVVPKDH